MTDLTPAQIHAAEAAQGADGIVKIGGYAGCGKTHVLRHLAETIPDIYVLTPTNKAAQVLRDRGVARAQTLFRAIYRPYEEKETWRDARGRQQERKVLKFVLRNPDELPVGAVALVDESSMIRQRELDDLCQVFSSVVLFGDPFQLPPVNSRDVFGGLASDVMLTEVHRTALDSPITRYATDVRNGVAPAYPPSDGEDRVWVGHVDGAMLKALVPHVDICLAWRNTIRHQVNDSIRSILGRHADAPERGERLICLVNSDNLYNGEMVRFVSTKPHKEGMFKTTVERDDGKKVEMKTPPFWQPGTRRQVPAMELKLDYAYCLTAHKAQGSEWPTVVVFDERAGMAAVERKKENPDSQMVDRWWYTAITRAKERLVIAQ